MKFFLFGLKRIRETDGNIKLVIAPSFNEEVINFGGALRVFNCYTTVEDAIKSYEYYSVEDAFKSNEYYGVNTQMELRNQT